MKNKLLNFLKNLIITIILVAIVENICFATSSYAAGETLGQLMRKNVSEWYRFILRVSMAVYVIAYLIIIIKLLLNRTPDSLKTIKESVLTFFVMFIIIYSLHYLMIAVFNLNNEGINIAKKVGANFSGIDMSSDEYDLYQTALSKAYEISAVPGFIGLLMYLLLVYYTYKFVFVYARRYINIIVLILLAPIIFVVSTIQKILFGRKDDKIKKWIKEFLFNVLIQTFHAVYYSMLIGLTLKLSDNNENLIGALLTLIMFGFIFSIDGIIRKMFNIVGGSTKISSRNAASLLLDVTEKLPGIAKGTKDGLVSFGKDVNNDGFKSAASNAISGIGEKSLGSVKNVGQSLIGKWNGVSSKAIEEAKDYNNILGGERVKANLTADEIVEQYHIMQEGKGLEGLRQGVQKVGYSIGNKLDKSMFIIKNLYGKVDRFTKRKLHEIRNEYKYMVEDLNHEIEIVKRFPKILRKYKKKRNNVVRSNGLIMTTSNVMMLTSSVDIDIEELIKELKRDLKNISSAMLFTFKEIGLQAFISPEAGSPRMGLAILAEDRYEEVAQHRVEEAITNTKREKRKLKLNNSVKDSETSEKVYKFSRFTEKSTEKIASRLLQKTRNEDGYLLSLDKVQANLDIDNLQVRGLMSKKTININQNMKAVRKDTIKSIREIKLKQQSHIINYNELYRKTNIVKLANNVAGRAMSAVNTIKLGFKSIDKMSNGQVGLRKMMRSGTAYQMPNDLVMMRKDNIEDKVKATGVYKSEANTVLQFVMLDKGELKQQTVTLDGKIVEPVDEIENSKENKNEEIVQKIVTLEGKVIQQVVNSDQIVENRYEVLYDGGEQLANQVSEQLTTEDLELPDDATAEEKIQKFEDLLQDINNEPLLEQILETSAKEKENEKERELDEIIVTSALEVNEKELRHLDYNENENARKFAVEQMVSTGVLSSSDSENEDIVGNALEVLNNRVKTLDTEELLDKVAEVEYVKNVEESLNNNNKDETVNLEQKINRFSDLLMGLATQKVEELEEMSAENKFEKEIENAEKKWAKRHKVDAVKDIAKKVMGDETVDAVKITLNFFGAVTTQGQSITLSNKNTIKEFYDKVEKLKGADLEKTQERFLQIYGDKLSEMQLIPFSFAKYPVLAMDGWSIYVVRSNEDVTRNEKTEQIDEEAENLLDKYYFEISRIFVKFIEENEITSFKELHSNIEYVKELTKRIKMLLFRKGEKNSQEKAVLVVDNLHRDIRFERKMKENAKTIRAKKLAEEKMERAKKRLEVKSKEEAEKEAEERYSEEEIEKDKEEQKENLAKQILDEVVKEEEEETIVNPDLQDLLNQLNENKVYIEIGNKEDKKQNIMRFQY